MINRGGLERLLAECHSSEHLPHDPVRFPRRYRDPADAEAVALIASSFAYGAEELFSAVLEKILGALGPSPARTLRDLSPRDSRFLRLYYRMNRGVDIAAFLFVIGGIIRRHGSIRALFERFWRERGEIHPLLSDFFSAVMAVNTRPVYGRNLHPHGLRFFFVDPSTKSACKRINMFLRWVARPDDGVDLGLWDFIPPDRLIVPLDTHLFRIGRYLKLTRRRTPGWRAAEEITNALRRIDPADPLKYDFALCHLGISGRCPIKLSAACCRVCPLLDGCARGRRAVRLEGSWISN